MARRKPKLLAPVRPNVGIEVAYRKRLERLIDEMSNSVIYWVSATYSANEPKIAQDALPAELLTRLMRRLARRWQKKFDDAALGLADYFAESVQKRSDATLRAILKRAGIAIDFTMTSAQKDVLEATVSANVALIKSIPAQYLAKVQGSVMRSVQSGRDLHSLAQDLTKEHGVTRRRATLIAKDQNNKATASMHRARQLELGIEEAAWLHSAGGNEPRPTHVAQSGKSYNIRTGWYDPAEKKYIQPGEEINCKCVSRSILPSFL